jgi:TDG/mug DNA glycosylase family protein
VAWFGRVGIFVLPGSIAEALMLPDYLDDHLRIVFCGTAAGRESARRRHYYSGPGNEFWSYLYQAGLTPRELQPEEDAQVTEFGLGLTDLAKQVAASQDSPGLRKHYDVSAFLEKMERYAPQCVAFHGKEAAKAVSRYLEMGAHVQLGTAQWRIGAASVFVLPSASGSNRDPSRLEGRPNRVTWYRELAGEYPLIGPDRHPRRLD